MPVCLCLSVFFQQMALQRWPACITAVKQHPGVTHFSLYCADTMLESYEHMRQDPFWMPVITDMKEGSWCDGGAKTAASFEDELAALARSGPKCILSASVIGRLQACFCPLVSCYSPHWTALLRWKFLVVFGACQDHGQWSC